MRTQNKGTNGIRATILVIVMGVLGLFPKIAVTAEPEKSVDTQTVWLESLDLTKVQQGWGTAQSCKAVGGAPLSIGGKKFEHGIGSHSKGGMTVMLQKGCTRFQSWVGVDDEAQKGGSVEFFIRGDGRLLWQSGVMRNGEPAKRVDVDVTGITQLNLEIGDAGDSFANDHADWADACLLVKDVKPQLVNFTIFVPAWKVRETGAVESELKSPDGKILISVSDRKGLSYHVMMDGKPVLTDSRLGLGFNDGSWIGLNTRIVKTKRVTNDSTWENHFGKRRIVRDHYKEMRLDLVEEGDVPRSFGLIVRAYDDGVALRYDLPRQPGLESFTIIEEATEFAFPDNYRCWGGDFSVCGENLYPERHVMDIGNPSVLPLLVELPHGFAAIVESDLIDWAGMFVAGGLPPSQGTPKAAAVKVSLAPRKDGHGLVVSATPRVSPWRVLMLGRKAADLPGSDLIANLATPSKIADTSWIKPGITAWDPWWAGSCSARGTTEGDKPYIDLAGKMGWSYQLVDWGWYKDSDVTTPNGTVNIPELIEYAKARNVKLLLWMHNNDLNHTGIEKAFSTIASWGVPGVKVDFMDSDSQETVQWYYSTLETAAKNRLMVDFHGAYKPTGLARTWPNYITQEGVLGAEYHKLRAGGYAVVHQITLPFTRGLLGPMDYTPGGFVNCTLKDFVVDAGARPNGNCQVIGSRARQLAMTVIYESPLLCLADSPKSYLGQPGVEFFRGLPTVWDDTMVPSAEVCKHIVIARRSGDRWYLAAMNAEEPFTVKVLLKFLGRSKYTIRSFADTPESGTRPVAIAESTSTVTARDAVEINMVSAGGFAAEIRPVGK